MAGKFDVVLTSRAKAELSRLKPFDRQRIVDSIVVGLTFEPFRPARNRKLLADVAAEFEFEPPLWELRVGEFRVFYDGGSTGEVVTVRSIRRKQSGKTTEEVLS